MANDASINPDIAERIAKDKEKLAEALKEMPIVLVACKKAGVSPATYYRWRSEDKQFRRRAEDAMAQGIEFVNDLTESQLIALIKEKKTSAIALWLKHNHKRYGARTQTYAPMAHTEDLSPEEEKIAVDALALASGGAMTKDEHGRQNRRRIPRENKE